MSFSLNFEKKNNFGGDTPPEKSFIGNGGSGRDVIIYNINNGNINNGTIEPVVKGAFSDNGFDSGWWNWNKWR